LQLAWRDAGKSKKLIFPKSWPIRINQLSV
jgi:hypothetical protein